MFTYKSIESQRISSSIRTKIVFTKKETVYEPKTQPSEMQREKKIYCLKIEFALTLQWNLNKQRAEIYLSGYKTKFNSPENYGKSNAHQRTKNISNYSKAAKVRAEKAEVFWKKRTSPFWTVIFKNTTGTRLSILWWYITFLEFWHKNVIQSWNFDTSVTNKM